MNHKLHHPTLFILVGIPGSGKTYLARQLSQQLKISRVSAEQIRLTILNQPSLSKSEERLVRKIAFFLIEELLKQGLSVICDLPATKNNQRAELNKLAKIHKFQVVTIHQQIDKQAAWLRCQSRHSHQIDDKYALNLDKEVFEILCGQLQPPVGNRVIVVSGSQNFGSQARTILRRLLELQLLPDDTASTKNIPKPGLINLVVSRKIRSRNSFLNISLKKKK